MWLECPNCRQPVSIFRSLRTPGWGTFRCRSCGSVLGVSMGRRVIGGLIWAGCFMLAMETLHVFRWGRLWTYGIMAASLALAVYLFEKVLLVERRAFTCRQCGYDLRALTEPRCPECGTPFDPTEQTRILERINAPPAKSRHVRLAVAVIAVLSFGVVGGLVAYQQATKLTARPTTAPATQPATAPTT